MTRLSNASDATGPTGDPRTISRWAQRYAKTQTRAIPVLAYMALVLAVFLVLPFLWRRMGIAYRAESWVAFWVCAAALVPAHVLLIWLAIPRWGPKRLARLGERYYQRAGSVTPQQRMRPERMKPVGLAVALLFATCIPLHVVLTVTGHLPLEAMQPISALYMVPFVAVIGILSGSSVPLLFGFLYALHAILVVAGAPIRMSGFWGAQFNFFGPLIGYALLAGGTAHLFNRFALAKLKRLAQSGLDADTLSQHEGPE